MRNFVYSLHVPLWGTTGKLLGATNGGGISIHAPLRGTTRVRAP